MTVRHKHSGFQKEPVTVCCLRRVPCTAGFLCIAHAQRPEWCFWDVPSPISNHTLVYTSDPLCAL
eukprot:70592-Prymnesium_polylepis.1